MLYLRGNADSKENKGTTTWDSFSALMSFRASSPDFISPSLSLYFTHVSGLGGWHGNWPKGRVRDRGTRGGVLVTGKRVFTSLCNNLFLYPVLPPRRPPTLGLISALNPDDVARHGALGTPRGRPRATSLGWLFGKGGQCF